MKEVHRERREREKMKLRDASAQCTIIDEPSGASLPLELPSEQLSADTVGAAPLAQHKSEFCALQPDYHFTDPFRKVSVNVSRLATVYFTQLGSAMFPIEFHLAYDPPAQLLVLDPSFIGDAVLQSLAFAAAVCATLAGGRRDDSIVTMEMSRTIGLINRLLEGGRGMADGLLGAVCNLAIGEVSGKIPAATKARSLMWALRVGAAGQFRQLGRPHGWAQENGRDERGYE